MPERKKLKITYIVPDFDENAYSGGLYVIFQHCNGLIESGHEVRVFNNAGKKSKYLQLNCPVELHKNDPSIVENNSPDIIVGTYWHTYFFINRMERVLKNNTKLCFLVQNNDKSVYSQADEPFIRRAMTTKYKGVILIHKIVVSQYLKDAVKNDFGEESFYVKNGLDVREVTTLLSRSGKTIIGARYDPSGFRGWDTVDKVLRRAAGERSDIEIHLFEMKDKKAVKYRNVFHKGLSGDSLLGFFKSCDIYLSGSRYEGFAYPVIEAMSQGACVCCTDAGGNREFCIDGETALMSPRDDAESLYRNLARLLDDVEFRDKIRKNGIKKAREFPWKESIAKLEEFFLSLAAQDYRAYPVELTDMNKRPEHKKGRVLFAYCKDPLAGYEDWAGLEESVKYFKDSGFDVTTMLLVDRHPGKSIKARLGMILPPDWVSSFRCKVFYSKKLKLRLPLLPYPIFIGSVAAELFRSAFLKKNRYDCVVFAPGLSKALRFLCKLLNIGFRELPGSGKKSLDKDWFPAKIC